MNVSTLLKRTLAVLVLWPMAMAGLSLCNWGTETFGGSGSCSAESCGNFCIPYEDDVTQYECYTSMDSCCLCVYWAIYCHCAAGIGTGRHAERHGIFGDMCAANGETCVKAS